MNVAPLALFDVVPAEMAPPGSSSTPESFAALLLTAAPLPARDAAEMSLMAANPPAPKAVLPEPATTDLAAQILPAPLARSPKQVLQMPPVDDEAAVEREASAPAAEDEARPLDPEVPIAVAVIVVPPPASGRIMLPDAAVVARAAPTVEAASLPESGASHRRDRPLEQLDGLPARPIEVASSLPVIQPIFAEPSPAPKSDARSAETVIAKPDRPSTLDPVALAVPTRVTVPARVEVLAPAAVLPLAAAPTSVVAMALPDDGPPIEPRPEHDAAPVSPALEARPAATAATTVLAVRSQPTVLPVPAAAVAATRTRPVIPMLLVSPTDAVARAVAAKTTPGVAETLALRRSVPRTVAQGIETAFAPAPAQQTIAAEPAAASASVRSSATTPAPEPTQVETEALGNVAIALDRRDAVLHVHFTVDRTSTAHALLDSALLLDGALQAGGARLDQLSVDVRGSDGRNATATGSDLRNPAPQSDGGGQRPPARDPRTHDVPRTFLPPTTHRNPRGTAQDRFA